MFNAFFKISILLFSYVSIAIANDTKHVDVAIVGGGLSGLLAAKDLVAAGRSVIVLEARDRVGGQVFNAKVLGGGVTKVGAKFVGPTQDRVLALAAYLGLSTFDTYNNGSSVLQQNNTRTLYIVGGATRATPPIDLPSLLQVGQAQGQLDAWAQEINVNTLWTHLRALEWDSQTLSSWLDTMTTLPLARFLLDVATTSIFSTKSSKLSLLYTLAYISSTSNKTMVRTLERLTEIVGGAQASCIVGSTQLLAIKLVERLGSNRVVLNALVRSVCKDDSVYEVELDKLIAIVDKVVIAMSLPLATRIIYDPILLASRNQLTQQMPIGSLGKAIAIYKTPFQRVDSLNSQVVSDSGVVQTTFDSSPLDGSYRAMIGFIEVDEMQAFDKKLEDKVKDAVLKDYINYFSLNAANTTSWVIQCQDNKEFSRGGLVAITPPQVLT